MPAPEPPYVPAHEFDYLAVDLENMLGESWSHLTESELQRRTSEILSLAGPRTQTLVVACPGLLQKVMPLVRHVAIRAVDGSVPDAADRVIQNALRARSWRQGSIVLATGDGGFALTVRDLRQTGSIVAVLAVEGSCSNELAEAADHVTLLQPCAPYGAQAWPQTTNCSWHAHPCNDLQAHQVGAHRSRKRAAAAGGSGGPMQARTIAHESTAGRAFRRTFQDREIGH